MPDTLPPPEDLLPTVIEIARAAGDVLLAHDRPVPHGVVRLKGRRDPVTDADLASERLIVERLRAAFPGTAIFAEEETREEADGRPIWYIDPLDGTVNFSQAHPFFAVSIALCDAEGPVVGVVFAPRLGELFAAARGAGATLNGKPLQVSRKTDLIDAVLATGFAYRRDELPDSNVEHFAEMVMRVRGMRRAGSAALDLAYTAAGRIDGYWEPHLNPFDMAAGALLVSEAGGRVTDMAGGDDWLLGGTVVAGGEALHAHILEVLDIADLSAVTGPVGA